MNHIKYNTSCSNCAHTNSVTSLIMVSGSVETYLTLTEYEFSKKLDILISKNAVNCEFCGSENVYAKNILINDVKLYDFETIVGNQKKSDIIEIF